MSWLAGWQYRKRIDVQSAFVDALLSDFPLHVPIKNDPDLAAALSTGHDLRFTQSDGQTLLKHERERWSGGGGSSVTADFWVKVPSISTVSGATLYVYYGKADAADGQDAANVWDANFKLVLHLAETSGSTACDSTGGAHHGTYQGNLPDGRAAAGVVGNGQDLDGAGDYIIVPDHADLRLTTGATVECWGKKRSDDPNGAVPWIGKETVGSNGYMLWQGNQQTSFFAYGLSAVQSGGPELALNTRYHFAGVFDGSYLRLYRDGVQQAAASTSGSIATNTRDLWIGRYHYAADAGYDACQDCEIDEVRVSDVGRSAAWIKFTHRNITEADNELTWGSAEEAAPAGSPWNYYYHLLRR